MLRWAPLCWTWLRNASSVKLKNMHLVSTSPGQLFFFGRSRSQSIFEFLAIKKARSSTRVEQEDGSVSQVSFSIASSCNERNTWWLGTWTKHHLKSRFGCEFKLTKNDWRKCIFILWNANRPFRKLPYRIQVPVRLRIKQAISCYCVLETWPEFYVEHQCRAENISKESDKPIRISQICLLVTGMNYLAWVPVVEWCCRFSQKPLPFLQNEKRIGAGRKELSSPSMAFKQGSFSTWAALLQILEASIYLR